MAGAGVAGAGVAGAGVAGAGVGACAAMVALTTSFKSIGAMPKSPNKLSCPVPSFCASIFCAKSLKNCRNLRGEFAIVSICSRRLLAAGVSFSVPSGMVKSP